MVNRQPVQVKVALEWRVFRSTVHTGEQLAAFLDPLLAMYNVVWYGPAYVRIKVITHTNAHTESAGRAEVKYRLQTV